MNVQRNGNSVNVQTHPELVPLAALLLRRRYNLGQMREVLAHALAFGTTSGVVRDDLLRLEDAVDAEIALGLGLGIPDRSVPADAVVIPPELEVLDEILGLERDDPAEPEPCKCGSRGSCACDADDHPLPPIAGGMDLAAAAPTALPRTLAETVDHEALAFRSQGTPVGAFLAGQMERLAQLIRFTAATTPAEYLDRFEALEADARATYYDRGHADGRHGTHSLV